MTDNFSHTLNQWITAPADVRALGLATLVLSQPERETVARVLEALASQPAAAAPAPQPQPGWTTAREAADRLGIHKRTLQRRAAAGEIERRMRPDGFAEYRLRPEEAEAPARRRGRDVDPPRGRQQRTYVSESDPVWFPGTADQQLHQAIRLWVIFSQRCTVGEIRDTFRLSTHHARRVRADLLAEGIVEIANENRGTMRLSRKRLTLHTASEEDVRRERSQLPAALATMMAARSNTSRRAAVSEALDLFGRVQSLDRTATKAALRSARLIAPRSGGNGQRDTWIGPCSLVDRDEDGEPAAPALWVVT